MGQRKNANLGQQSIGQNQIVMKNIEQCKVCKIYKDITKYAKYGTKPNNYAKSRTIQRMQNL